MVNFSRPDSEEMAATSNPSKEDEQFDPLRTLIPIYARVQVPLESTATLLHAADLLRSLAMQLDQLSRQADLGESSALFEAWTEIKSANAKMAKAVQAAKAAQKRRPLVRNGT